MGELVKVETALPAHLLGMTGKGLQDIGRDEVILPRLAICQSMSPERKRGHVKYIEGLTEGDLFNTVTKRVFEQPLEIIPLLFAKSRILFNDLQDGGGIACSSPNGLNGGRLSPSCTKCDKAKFGNDGAAPECNLVFNFPSLLADELSSLLVVSFKSTALKAGKLWNSLLTMTPAAFARVYSISTTAQSNSKGDFFGPVIKPVRWVTENELKFAEAQYEAIKNKKIAANTEPDEEINLDGIM